MPTKIKKADVISRLSNPAPEISKGNNCYGNRQKRAADRVAEMVETPSLGETRFLETRETGRTPRGPPRN
jgi:hypothetical protein